ncbi:MAG: hypothetical protein IT454_08895 [Planctomycetes bacterium]|nr:hypothetical protein [Planctomycetota bacterium]
MSLSHSARTVVWIGLASLLLCAAAFADVFTLNDGRKIEGKLKRETASSYFVETSVGELELKKSEVQTRVAGKTPRETFDERFAAAKSAEEFFAAGEYAREQKLKALATKAWKRAVELDARHEGAHKALGHVLYRGTWMTPEERDQRAVADEDAEMAQKGFVRWKDSWVTPEEKAKLEQGLILRDGVWISEAESKRKDGLELFEGQWYPKAEALARGDVGAVAAVLGRPLRVVCNAQAAIAGDYGEDLLGKVGGHLVTSRAWFDASFKVEPGLKLLGNRLAEFYLWNRDSGPYQATVAHFGALTPTVPEGWAPVVKERHGFFWIDPYALSSARVWNRPDEDLVGHCVHHWGHMLLGRLGYEGRLLPPWYDEGFASLAEYKLFQRNAVFCRSASSSVATTGTSAKKAAMTFNFDAGLFREGAWSATLKKALEAGVVPSFDRLSSLDIGQLELLDIACGMAITWWLEEFSPDALSKFHAVLRKTQAPAPTRVLPQARERQAQYEQAFQAAVGLGWRDADLAWRAWFQKR